MTTWSVHRRLMKHAQQTGCSVETATKMIDSRVEMLQREQGLSIEQAREALAREWQVPIWQRTRDEDLKVGDVVNVLGRKRITAIRPYAGPLVDIIFALADTDTGPGFSLERGGWTERLEVGGTT